MRKFVMRSNQQPLSHVFSFKMYTVTCGAGNVHKPNLDFNIWTTIVVEPKNLRCVATMNLRADDVTFRLI